MNQVKIVVTTTIGTEGARCWQCQHGDAGNPYCSLFCKRRTMSEPGAPWSRLAECIEAKSSYIIPLRGLDFGSKNGDYSCHVLAFDGETAQEAERKAVEWALSRRTAELETALRTWMRAQDEDPAVDCGCSIRVGDIIDQAKEAKP